MKTLTICYKGKQTFDNQPDCIEGEVVDEVLQNIQRAAENGDRFVKIPLYYIRDYPHLKGYQLTAMDSILHCVYKESVEEDE